MSSTYHHYRTRSPPLSPSTLSYSTPRHHSSLSHSLSRVSQSEYSEAEPRSAPRRVSCCSSRAPTWTPHTSQQALPHSNSLPLKLRDVADEACEAILAPAVAIIFHAELLEAHAQLCEEELEFWHVHERDSASSEPELEIPPSPDVEEVMAFVSELQWAGAFDDGMLVIALLYFLRFRAATGEALAPGDWRGALLVCVLLAQKVHDDEPVVNSEFRKVYPELEVSDINELELVLLLGMGWNVGCTDEAFTQYYVHLTSMTWDKSAYVKAQQSVQARRHLSRASKLQRVRPWDSSRLLPAAT